MENTTTLTTAGGHTIVLKNFITGRDKRHITDSFLEDVVIHQDAGAQNFSIAASKANIATDRALMAVVVSVDGKTENIVDEILNLPATDSDEVIAAVNDITGEKKTVAGTA